MLKKKWPLVLLGAFILYPVLLFLFSGMAFHYKSYFTISAEGVVEFNEAIPNGWSRLPNVSSRVIWPIVISEDWAFYEHSGIDLRQLYIVTKESLKTFSLGRGASTITQQVVKNLYLSSQRSIFRKFNEMILALILEQLVEKKWILEQYVNLAEFGPKIYGIKKASFYYFKTTPFGLSYKQGAFLAMLLPSPLRYGESFRETKLTEFAREQIESILKKLVLAKVISKEQMSEELVRTFNWEQFNALPSEEEYLHP
jgi:monofunctional biosynthetic peptidoglycan transglycosylase